MQTGFHQPAGTAFATFNGGSRDVLVEFAQVSLVYRMKK